MSRYANFVTSLIHNIQNFCVHPILHNDTIYTIYVYIYIFHGAPSITNKSTLLFLFFFLFVEHGKLLYKFISILPQHRIYYKY